MSPLAPITTHLVTGESVVDIYIAENRYALIATSGTVAGGIDVVDLFQGEVVASGILPDFPTAVTADWTTTTGVIYIGTSNNGIYTARYHTSRRGNFSSSITQTYTTASTPPISHNSIRDLDVLPGKLLVGTASGTDFIADYSHRSVRLLISGTNDVHLTSDGGGYWTTHSGSEGEVEVNYGLISTTGTGIIDVDFRYSILSSPALPAAPPFDIAITESSPRALAFATPSGVLLTEEAPGAEGSAAWNHIVPIIPGQNNAVIAVDFSPGADYNDGLLYVTTTGSVQVIGLHNSTVSGTHLSDEGERGQVILSGTLTSMRTTGVA